MTQQDRRGVAGDRVARVDQRGKGGGVHQVLERQATEEREFVRRVVSVVIAPDVPQVVEDPQIDE
jgi:putative ribosome biogenesis GTPase RsgA